MFKLYCFTRNYFISPLILKHYSLFVFLFLLSQMQYAFSDDLVPLKIVINTQDKGEYFVLLTSSDVLVNEDDFKTLGLRISGIPIDVDGIRYVSLSKLKNKFEYEIDEKSLSLVITIDPVLLDKTVVDLSRKTVIRSNPFGIDSAFLNYGVVQNGSNKQTFKAIDTPLEGVISAHDMLLEMNFNYSRGYTGNLLTKAEWSRGITRVTKDYPKKLNRLSIGDVRASSGELGGGGLFLGVSYGKKFNMATYFTKYPSVSVNGLLRTPSRVNMYANGVLVRSEVLPPGEFSINNLPNLYGAGNLELEVIDAFGRVVRQNISYYVSTKLLKVGLHDFLYTVGFNRKNSLTSPRAEYASNPTLLAYHRYGLSRYLTMGYRFEYSDELKNIGSSANILLGPLGEAEVGVSVSETVFDNVNTTAIPSTETGIAKYFRYGFTSRYVHGRYAYLQRSSHYNFVGVEGSVNEKTFAQQSVGLGVHGLVVGSLALGYSLNGSFAHPEDRVYSAIYSLRIAKQANLIARFTRTEDDAGVMKDAFVVSVSAALGNKVSINGSYSKDDENQKTSAYVQKSVPVGTGFGGRLRLDRTETQNIVQGVNQTELTSNTETILGAGYLIHKSKYLSVNGEYSLGEDEDSYNTQIAGALAFIDNDFYWTRPIQDSFGLAKVDDLDDVGVYYGSELIGKTSEGRLMIPNLVSYADNHISINGQDVPVDRALKNTNRRVSPKFRTGSVALFDVEKFQGFFGNIFLQKNETRKSADYAHLSLQKSGQIFDTVIGKGGEFYFENLTSGTYRAETKLDGETCRFKIKIPESKEMMVELGEYVCKQ